MMKCGVSIDSQYISCGSFCVCFKGGAHTHHGSEECTHRPAQAMFGRLECCPGKCWKAGNWIQHESTGSHAHKEYTSQKNEKKNH